MRITERKPLGSLVVNGRAYPLVRVWLADGQMCFQVHIRGPMALETGIQYRIHGEDGSCLGMSRMVFNEPWQVGPDSTVAITVRWRAALFTGAVEA